MNTPLTTRELVIAFYNAIAQRDHGTIRRLGRPDYIQHNPDFETGLDGLIRTLQALRKSGAEVWIWSGRSDECKTQTVEWLQRHGCFGFPTDVLWAWPFGAPERFRMRKAGDYRDDVEVKREWLVEIEPPEWDRLTAVFDDRDRVVRMWRDAGVTCFQVAPGEF